MWQIIYTIYNNEYYGTIYTITTTLLNTEKGVHKKFVKGSADEHEPSFSKIDETVPVFILLILGQIAFDFCIFHFQMSYHS